MKKINWKQKLTSRKFWVAIASFVSGLIIAFGAGEEIAVAVSGVIMSGGTAIAYIIGEGLVDAAVAGNSTNTEINSNMEAEFSEVQTEGDE